MLNISVIFMIVAFILFCICISSQHMLLERDVLLTGKTAIAGTGYTTQNACKQRKMFLLSPVVFFFSLLEKNALTLMLNMGIKLQKDRVAALINDVKQ